jgi:hypothetical protein
MKAPERLAYEDEEAFDRARERLARAAAVVSIVAAKEPPSRWPHISAFDLEDLGEACRELEQAQFDFWRVCSELLEDDPFWRDPNVA